MSDLKQKIIDEIIRVEGGYVNDPEVIENAIRCALIDENRSYSLKVYTPDNSRSYMCAQNGCNNNAYAKGYCNAHYLRMRNGTDMSLPLRNRNQSKDCITCGEPITAKGGYSRCTKHYKQRRYEVIKEILVKLLGGKCSKCDNSYPLSVYDFHHVDPAKKKYSVGWAITNISAKNLAIEVSKCVLLCANCHRIDHHVES